MTRFLQVNVRIPTPVKKIQSSHLSHFSTKWQLFILGRSLFEGAGPKCCRVSIRMFYLKKVSKVV